MVDSMNSDIDAARGVLGLSSWELANGLYGRPLVKEDLDSLLAIGASDPEFAWERDLQGRAYFENLLSFRMDHYTKYGFGVHGVWYESEMIGQFGLQVLDEQLDEVEIVVFLHNRFVSRGFGSALVDFALANSRRQSMRRLFGLVRTDNVAGRKLMKKYAGVPRGQVDHFGFEADVFIIELDDSRKER